MFSNTFRLLFALSVFTLSSTASSAQSWPIAQLAQQILKDATYTSPAYRQVRPHVVHPQVVCPQIVRPQPVRPQPVQPPVAPPQPLTKVQRARQLVAQAKSAFAVQEYARAKRLLDQVVSLTPEQADAYQFRALALFAQHDYDAAAADVYDLLLRGPMWTWPTLRSLYSSAGTYTQQYQMLADTARQDEQSMSKHFLLAYHHLVLGHLEHGEKELVAVLKIKPDETVSRQLLQVVRAQQAKATKLAGR